MTVVVVDVVSVLAEVAGSSDGTLVILVEIVKTRRHSVLVVEQE